MKWNGWRYWRPVMWLVSESFRRRHEKTIRPKPDLRGLLPLFVYPVIPGTYESRFKFLRAEAAIFSPSAYRTFLQTGKVWPLKLRKAMSA